MSATGLKITNFHMLPAFPKAEYAEYPKWIHMTGYKSEIVQTAEDEAILRARAPVETQHSELVKKLAEMPPANFHAAPQPADRSPVLAGPNDERELLLKIAEEKDIKVDRRWKLERLRNTIAKATEHL